MALDTELSPEWTWTLRRDGVVIASSLSTAEAGKLLLQERQSDGHEKTYGNELAKEAKGLR
jgi:hypothetical protein